MKKITKKLIITSLSFLIFSIGCTKKKKVKEKNEKSSRVSMRMPIYPKPLTASTTIRYAATANTEGFHLSDMTTNADITCFAVVVKTDGVASCQSAAAAPVLLGDVVFGSVPQGGEISFEVPNGPERTFYLIGFHSTLATCPDYNVISLNNRAQMSTPYVLATHTEDLNGGDVSISMTVSLTLPNNRIKKCFGGPFAWEESNVGVFGSAIFGTSVFGP